MTYKEFKKWCYEKACECFWELCDAYWSINCIATIETRCKGVFKARKKEKVFHDLYEKQAIEIVNTTNRHKQKLLGDEKQ